VGNVVVARTQKPAEPTVVLFVVERSQIQNGRPRVLDQNVIGKGGL